MHRFNRFYLMFSLIFSLVLPLITIEWFTISGIKISQSNLNQIQGQYVKFEVLFRNPGEGSVIQLKNIYFLVLSILITRFVYNILILRFRSGYSSVIIRGHKIVPVKGLALPHTFLSTVFINEDELKQGKIPDALLIHEFAHIEQYHSIDIIIIEVIKTIFWFNPVLILYKRAIMLNHEYLADDAVLESHSDVAGYSEILFNIVFRKNNKYLASSFNYSLTKKDC